MDLSQSVAVNRSLTLTPSHSNADWSPVWREAVLHRPDQQHQLGPIHTVPHKGGQQEEVEQSRHSRTRATIRFDVFVRVWDDVGFTVDLNQSVVLSAGVFHPREEGDDEGQQADVDTQQRDL